MEQSKNIDTLETYKEATPRRRRSPRCSVVRVASLLGVRGTPTTCSAAGARRQLLPVAVAATPPSKARAIAHSAAAARRREMAVVAATPLSATVAITRSATAARRREAEVDARTCFSDLARYTESPREEEERLVEHTKSLTAVVAAAHAASEARNQEIYEENHRFERGRLERHRAFEVSVAEAATAAGTVLRFPGSSVGSSSAASY